MIKKKKLILVLFLTFLTAITPYIVLAQHEEDIDFGDLSDISLDDLQQFEQEHMHTRGGVEPTLVLVAGYLRDMLVKPKSLWLNTKPPKGRDVLYLLPHKITTLEYGGLALSLFFNMTDKMHVGAASLIDFDNVSKDNLMTGLNVVYHPSTFTEDHLNQLIDKFRQFNIQDRKIGSFIQGGFVKGPFSLQLQTSILLAAKNFWLDKRSQQEIRQLLGLIDQKLAEGNLD